MAKKGFTIDTVQSFLAASADKAGWSLCIGAGTSVPIFPDWYKLAEELAKEILPSQPINMVSMKNNGFSPDALIQMVKNVSGLSDHDFAMKMSEVLYRNFKSKVDPKDWGSITKVLQSNFISHIPSYHWKKFIEYRDVLLENTTANKLAPVILKAVDNDVAPKSIISFNAEPIFLMILNSLLIEKNTDEAHPNPKKVFCKIINSVSESGSKQIPYIFCHGLLPITEDIHKFTASIDQLIFLEEEYLQIANNAFSWQSATFLNACTTQHIVFIGTSLTDPNMRRWLSWVYSNRIKEMQQNGVSAQSSTQHYWIRTYPKDDTDIPWIESIVAHLGVRVVWIDAWDKATLVLERMLGISPSAVIPKNKTPIKRAKTKNRSGRSKKKRKQQYNPGAKLTK